jgi:tetratricopeptide (TPR) repeat protein
MPLSPPRGAALLCRSLALFAVLYQIRFIARDMADTPVFAASLVCAFAGAWFLAKLRVPAVPGAVVLLVSPWAARSLIALPRFFMPALAIPLDSLLLSLDRNIFVFIFPFYWAALGTWFSLGSRRFLRGDIAAADALLAGLFCVSRTADIEAYRWPVLMIALVAGLIYLQILALLFSLPPEYGLKKKEGVRTALVFLVLVILGGLLLIRPVQEKAVDKSGGLLQPNLFRFDFSRILRLESEIALNDDLILILRKDPEDTHILLRRFVLSGYNRRQGFFLHEDVDDAAHPRNLPPGRVVLSPPPIQNYRVTDQEYFLVNFDSSAFIGMNMPVEIIPYNSWDASSFKSAYGVQSHTSEVLPFELVDSVPGLPGPEVLGLSREEYDYYTEYGGDAEIAAFAREITGGLENYWEMVQAVHERLKYGEYRYSLKPGIAPEGDQLKYFLFESKKGYCSYYAFAMTLLLRSLGIPSRVAVGFFINPDTDTFNYYPVQANMAHAWTEVYYPEYGWVEYDPTTPSLAEGEDFQFSAGAPQDVFERLMKEILENRSRLGPREESAETPAAAFPLGRTARRVLREQGLRLLALLLAGVNVLLRAGHLLACGLTKNPRKKARRLWAHTLRRMRLGGFPRSGAEPEWAQAMDAGHGLGLYALYQDAAAARYAPEYGVADFAGMKGRYASFSAAYGKTAAPFRRVLAWVFPPLALILPAAGTVRAAVLLLILALAVPGHSAPHAQERDEKNAADALYEEALLSESNEFWERAIEVYSRGEALYPGDPRFPWALGSLYYSRRLYNLAWDEYRKVETLRPQDVEALYRLSQTAGHLNWDRLSAEYLERILALEPENRDAIGSLGWMYYKLHRPEEGEKLLLDALDRFGLDADYAMTLGTLYSDMFRYDEAKTWYLAAIAMAEELGDREFTAVAHYNLSILESRFYLFNEAFDRTNASLAARNRASGRLARGELFLRRLDFPRAFGEYQAAYEIDTSPLSKVSLAQAYRIAGRLEEARVYAEDCLNSGDHSWMINYGIDPDRYKRDLHEILYLTYRGLAKTEARMVYGSAADQVRGFFRGWAWRFKEASHRRLFQKYCLLAAGAFWAADANAAQRPDALIRYYHAFDSYPRRALTYLRQARKYEVPAIPQAEPSYDLEEGTLLKKPELLGGAIPQLDPLWERDMIAEAYTALASPWAGKTRTSRGRDAVERLYALNRGGVRQNGLALPVELALDTLAAQDNPARAEGVLRRVLKKMGVEAARPGDEPRRFRLSLSLSAGDAAQRALCELYDAGRGVILFRRAISLPSLSGADISAFARELGDALFVEN